MQSGADVLVVGEAASDGSPRPVSWEMFTPARQIALNAGEDGSVIAGHHRGAGLCAPRRRAAWHGAGGGLRRVRR